MKSLGSLSNNGSKKKSSTLIESVEVETTTSRKIMKSDYDLLKRYAFYTDQNMTSALNVIYNKISKEINNKGYQILPTVNEDNESSEQKNVRISVEFNRYLKELSFKTDIPAKYLLTSCLSYLKDDLIEDIKNSKTHFDL